VAALTVQQVEACIHPRQRPRFFLALLFALLLTPFVVVFGGLFLGLVPWIVFLIWVSAEVLFAHFTGNAILVSATNYPRIQELTGELKTTLGVDKQVNVFIFEQGMFNAYMTRLFFRRAVFLSRLRPSLAATPTAFFAASTVAVNSLRRAGSALRMPYLARCLAGRRSLLQLVGLFLVFELDEVGDVQERIALQAKVDKCRLHARQNPCHASVVNGTR